MIPSMTAENDHTALVRRHAYWSGYFTTRPALKRNVIEGSGYLQAARQLQLFAEQPLRLHLQGPGPVRPQ
jgi:hypothetical protein